MHAVLIADHQPRPGYGKNHPLSIPRVSLTLDVIKAYQALAPNQIIPTRKVSLNELLWFHRRDYITAIKTTSLLKKVTDNYRQNYNFGTAENPYFDNFFDIPAKATGASIQAAEALLSGIMAFNPAGGMHHALPAKAEGFCFFNDVALGVLRLRKAGLKVLYIDIDAHHGDGIEFGLKHDENVLMLSFHMDTSYAYPFKGGKITDWNPNGNSINIPLPKNTNDQEYDWLWQQIIPAVLEKFKPDAIVLQAGADALFSDPLGKLQISTQQFLKMVQHLITIAPKHNNGNARLMVTGGGGYHPLALARCWTGVWGLLAGIELPVDLPEKAIAILKLVDWDLDEDQPYFENFFQTRLDTIEENQAIRKEIYALWNILYKNHPLWQRS